MQEKTFSLDDLINDSEPKEIQETKVDEPIVEEPKKDEQTVVKNEETTNEKKEETKPKIITPNMISKSKGSEGVKIVNAEDIKPFSPNKEDVLVAEYHKEMNKLIDDNIERTKQELMRDKIQPYINKCKEIAEEEEFAGNMEVRSMNDMISNAAQPSTSLPQAEDIKAGDIRSNATSVKLDKDIDSKVTDSLETVKELELDENDFLEEEKNVDSTLSEDELNKEVKEDSDEDDKITFEKFKVFQNVIQENIGSGSSVDLTGFSMSNTPLNINTAMSHVAKVDKSFTESQSVPLFNTGRTISFTPLTGSDIVKLSSESYNSQLDHLKKVFATMYSHDVSPNKPATFIGWMKSIDAGDIDQLYFGLYKSTFIGSNYIGYQKPESKEFMMVKCKMEDMYSFNEDAKEEDKKRFEEISKHGEVEDNLESRKEDYVLSENYVLRLRPRTLYNMIELEYLDDEFRKKYESVYLLSSYIDKAYFIDRKHKILRPIDFKPDRNSIVKSIKNKILVIYKLITSITPDNYSMFNGKLSSFSYKEVVAGHLIDYHIPAQEFEDEYIDGEKKGQKFKNHIEKESMTPYQLLFTRHQLAMQSTWRID